MSLNKPSTFTRYLGVAAALGAGLMLAMPISAHEVEHDRSNDIRQSYDLSGFDAIDIRGVYELEVEVGGDFSVSTSGRAKEVKGLKVYVENGTLVLDQDNGRKNKKWNDERKGVLAIITMPALNELEIKGVGTGDINGIDAKSFELSIGGVGELELSGTCDTLEADMRGVGQIDARDLKCENAEATLRGVGEISLYASESVDVEAKGIGEVNVYGNPAHVEKSKGFMSGVTIH